MADENRDQHWSLDKRVPLAMLLALAFQAASLAYWIAGVENRGISNERRIALVETAVQQMPERLTRVEVLLETIRDEIRRGQRGKGGD
jgi:hypothetical protein